VRRKAKPNARLCFASSCNGASNRVGHDDDIAVVGS
jgi:hypothetical protein